jgi:DivIVA domain-containing protein
MMWFFAVLIVLAMGGVAVLAAGKGRPLAEEYGDRPDALVPATGRVGAEDLRRIRFSLAVRGYRMSEVDALLDRLASEIEQAEKKPDEAKPDADEKLDEAKPDADEKPDEDKPDAGKLPDEDKPDAEKLPDDKPADTRPVDGDGTGT